MKRLSIADIKTTEILSIEEKKSIVGGGGYHNPNGPILSTNDPVELKCYVNYTGVIESVTECGETMGRKTITPCFCI